jgi:hypothetical protein
MIDKSELTMKSWPMGATSPTTKLTVEGSIVGANIAPPKIVFTSQSGDPVMTIHPDGTITLGDDAKPTEAAVECINAMDHMIRDMIDNAVQVERNRIIGIIKGRIDIYDSLVNGCARNQITVPNALFKSLGELRLLLREIEQ